MQTLLPLRLGRCVSQLRQVGWWVQFYVPCIVQRPFLVFLACQYVLHCVYSGLSVDCFNKDYHHHHYHLLCIFLLRSLVHHVYIGTVLHAINVKMFLYSSWKFKNMFLYVFFNVVFLWLLEHKRTKWCISHGQIAFSVYFLDKASETCLLYTSPSPRD